MAIAINLLGIVTNIIVNLSFALKAHEMFVWKN